MKKTIWLTSVVLGLAISACGQSVIAINARGQNFDVGRNLTWGNSGAQGFNNAFSIYSVSPWPTSGLCISVKNNNPTSGHTFNFQALTTADPQVAYLIGQQNSSWSSVVNQTGVILAQANSGSSMDQFYVSIAGAARVILLLSAGTVQTGSPDTADVYATGTNGSACPVQAPGITPFPNSQVMFVSSIPLASSANAARGFVGTALGGNSVTGNPGTVYALSVLNPNTTVANLVLYDGTISTVVWCEALPASGKSTISFPTGLQFLSSINGASSTTCSNITNPTTALIWNLTYK